MLVYILIAVCVIQLFAISVLVMAVTASSEMIDDLKRVLRHADGEH
jgi:hypothetical protein